MTVELLTSSYHPALTISSPDQDAKVDLSKPYEIKWKNVEYALSQSNQINHLHRIVD